MLKVNFPYFFHADSVIYPLNLVFFLCLPEKYPDPAPSPHRVEPTPRQPRGPWGPRPRQSAAAAAPLRAASGAATAHAAWAKGVSACKKTDMITRINMYE